MPRYPGTMTRRPIQRGYSVICQNGCGHKVAVEKNANVYRAECSSCISERMIAESPWHKRGGK